MRIAIFRRAAVAMLVGFGAILAGVTPAMSAQTAAVGPVCIYQVTSDWGSGFTVQVTITNNGPALGSWVLQYAYSGNQHLVTGWNGNWSQAGQTVTVANAPWNGSLATGRSTTLGAVFSYSGTNTPPSSLTLNGLGCNANSNNGPPTVSITSPAAGSEVPSGSTVTVSASASAGGAGAVSAVTFYADNYCTGTATDLGAVTAAPYTVQWANVPVGNFAISAVITTSQGVSAMSAAVELTTTSQGLPPPCPVPGGDPVVAVVTPQQNSILDSNTTATVAAVASIASGSSISSVTFYAVDTCGQTTTLTLGAATSAPYTVQWANPPAGVYTLTAVASTGGVSVTSAPVQVAAGPNRIPPPCPAPTPTP